MVGISTGILVLIVSIANAIVGKLILGSNRRKVSETEGKYIQIWGLVVIAILGICSIFFFVDILDANVLKWFWLFFLILTVGFHSFLEWKFLRESKEYVVSLIVLMIGIIYILLFMF